VAALPARPTATRVAALYDVHGNLPALEAVLAEVGDAELVFGGDMAWGPLPAETVDRIRSLEALAIRGNADRDLGDDWIEGQLGPERLEWLQTRPERIELDVDGVGRVLFCHGSPRSDMEMILKTTPDKWLLEMLVDVEADVVVCGHTHMQFDRGVDRWRVVNAGSVGLAYGTPGAHWLSLGPEIEHRRTVFDQEAFAELVRATEWPRKDSFIADYVEACPSEKEVLEFFEPMAAEQHAERYPGRS
jgi:predicted phosphodiesterase